MKKRIVVALFLLLGLLTVMSGCRRSNWNDGEFRGEAQGYGGPIRVNVTVQRGKINAIVVTEHNETAAVYDQAANVVVERIIQKQTVQVDNVSGATRTSEGIKAAVGSALETARKR